MLKLIIYKNKITTTRWEESLNDWSEHDIATLGEPITQYFDTHVEIKQDVTVEDFMKHLEKYERDIDYLFAGYINDVPFRLFLEDMKKPTDIKSDLGEIELCWEGEIINGELLLFGFLRGFLTPEKLAEIGQEQDVPHDITFLSLNMWKDCYLRFNEGMIINNLGEYDDMKRELVFEGYHSWRLFEVISNFLADISMNGTPDERDAKAENFLTKKYDVKEVAQDKQQANYWMEFLESELEDMHSKMTEILENEEFEIAEVLKKEIQAVEIELHELKKEVDKYNTH